MELCGVAAMMGWLVRVCNGVVVLRGKRTRLYPSLGSSLVNFWEVGSQNERGRTFKSKSFFKHGIQ